MKRKIINIILLVSGAVIIFLMMSNVAFAQSRLFEYADKPVLNEKQQHYANAWLTKEYVNSYAYVKVNISIYDGNFINVNLPSDKNLTVEKSDLITHKKDLFTWIGTFNNAAGTAAFEVHGNMVTARIASHEFTYLLYPITGNLHLLISTSGYPRDESEEGYRQMLEQGIKSAQENHVNRIDPETGTPFDVQAGACKVRVLVAYTDDADANLADPIAFVNSCITATNVAYNSSLISFNVELAVAIREVYTESLNSSTDVTRFRNTADGFLDDVHDYRTYFDADLNVLITENVEPGICGRAYTVANSPYADAFCVVTRDCAVGNLSFPHELGHLYGARHDTYVDATNTPYAYGHGYVYMPGQWRTIMAYNDQCSDNGFNCTRIQRFSNPAVSYLGNPTGTSTKDNESAHEASKANISSLETTLTDKIFVNSYTFSNGEYADVIATNSVTNSTTYLHSSGSQGSWRAGGPIILAPGFRASAGSTFYAFIDNCTTLRVEGEPQNQPVSAKISVNNDYLQVQPNPFTDNFEVVYHLSKTGKVQIQLFDMAGREIRDLLDQNFETEGQYRFTFNGKELKPGIYLCKVVSASGMKTIRITKAE